ncbi:MAG: acetylxylan esterase, partial [Leptospira sp.]|nr:acetylxylan esterase [Leptospira sp.]
RPEVKENETNDWTPGYFYSSAERKEDFYMKYLYLDVLRAIDFLRLTDGIDGDRIIIQGKSLGGALAAFGAAYSERVKAIVAETPNFSYVDDEQMQTEGPWVKELNAYLSRNRTRKASLKKTISYFDTLNFTDKIKVPALFSCGMDDRISNPKAIFAAFNHLNCDKRMQLYPNEGNEAGKDKQEKANLEFYKEIFNLNGT